MPRESKDDQRREPFRREFAPLPLDMREHRGEEERSGAAGHNPKDPVAQSKQVRRRRQHTRFAGGVVTHAALRTFDYHRWHAPAAGTVLETRVIQGRAWLDVQVEESPVDGGVERRIEAVEGTGYQFLQTRGLVVLDTGAGLVACLPVGMAQVSSVVITAEVGAVLRKGEEMGYFQFGRSDFVMVFEAGCAVRLDATQGQSFRQGQGIGRIGR